MLNTVYQLKRPRQFEVAFKEMEIDDRQVIVRPTRLYLPCGSALLSGCKGGRDSASETAYGIDPRGDRQSDL